MIRIYGLFLNVKSCVELDFPKENKPENWNLERFICEFISLIYAFILLLKCGWCVRGHLFIIYGFMRMIGFFHLSIY